MGWLPHTTRAALSRLRSDGQALAKAKREDGTTTSRILPPEPGADVDPGRGQSGWPRVFGRTAPPLPPKVLLHRALAYRLQVEALGGLDRQTLRALDRMAGDGRLPGGVGIRDLAALSQVCSEQERALGM